MSELESSARARQLGAELKRLRTEAGLSARELAIRGGWSPSKVCRMEGGKRGPSEVDVAIYLSLCGSPRRDIDRLIQLAAQTDAEFRLQEHDHRLPDQLRTLIELETTAKAIAGYEPGVVPGLLQTEDYIRALLAWGRREQDEAFELLVRARLARQNVVHRHWPPRLTFFVHEHALRAVVGGNLVMHEQLLQLTLLSARQRCEIRVLEASAAPLGVFGSGFYLLAHSEHAPVAYTQTHTASLFLDDAERVRAYRSLLEELATYALNRGQSREWLAALASEYDRVETDRDDRVASGRADLA